MDCVVSMETLTREPYMLGLNSKIVARSRALNQQGQGEFNAPNNFTTVSMRLIPKDRPIVRKELNNNTPTLTWNSLFDRKAIEYQRNYFYEVWWDRADGR